MPDSENIIHIESHRGFRPYSRMIFGHFVEHFHRQVYGGIFDPGSPLADGRGFRMDVMDALRELKIPVVRWPGGCFASAYHWLDGVGSHRTPHYDKAWRVEEPNAFGTDEFVAWCRMIGAEPYICTNAGTGTPEEMSNWVEYCNLASSGRWARLRRRNGLPEPHRVRYWSIGNENYADWEIGAKTKEEWGRFVKESAKMMKQVDPEIKLAAAALPDADWTLSLLGEAGRYLDSVSIHGYWDHLAQKDDPADYLTCMRRAADPERMVLLMKRIIAVAGLEGRIGIAFDEWNLRGWHHPDGNGPGAIAARDRNDRNATYTMADAVFCAGFLNTCLRHADAVHMANIAPAVNTRGPLFVHANGIVKRSTFHVLSMYANAMKENVADVWMEGEMLPQAGHAVPLIDAVATCDDRMRSWSLAVINRHPDKKVVCRVSLGRDCLEGPYHATILGASSRDDFNDIAHPDRIKPHETRLTFTRGRAAFPPHSLTIVQM